MSKRLRIGVIGAGNVIVGHLKSLASRPEAAEVVAIADPAPGSIARLRERVPEMALATAFSDHRAMLAESELDGVIISSPHTLHYGQVLDCLERGLHVLSEKPLVCSVADTREIIARANARKLAVVVGYQRRFQGRYRAVRDFVRDPAFGTPLFVQAYQSQFWYQLFLQAWRTDPALSGGGQINDSGSHLIDMLFWIMPSRPIEVCALMHNRGTRVDVDSALSFRFENGCLGNLSIHGSGPKVPGMVEEFKITGDSGRAIYVDGSGVTATRDGVHARIGDFPADGNRTLHWIEVMLGQAKNESPPEEFVPTIAFTEACWASAARGGQPVVIDYEAAAVR